MRLAVRKPAGADAVAGLALSILGVVPFFGLVFGLFGITCAAIAIRRDSGRRLAVAGFTVGVTILVWQLAGTLALIIASAGCHR